jgi:AbrB family looped-hinge helix DNA binding protein
MVLGGMKNMNNPRNNIASNLRFLRSQNRMSQEEVAEKIGVTRQAVAKWENGDSLPDILNCEALAELYDVSLNDLVQYDPEDEGMPIPPKNKHLFGVVTLGERGQIVLPKKARDIFKLQPGDTLVVLGDTNPATPGMALVDSQSFLRMTGHAVESIFREKGDN